MKTKKTTTTTKKAHSATAHKAHHGATAVAEPVAPVIDTPVFSEPVPVDIAKSADDSDDSMAGW